MDAAIFVSTELSAECINNDPKPKYDEKIPYDNGRIFYYNKSILIWIEQ